MQWELTSLALNPEIAVDLLCLIQFQSSLDEDFLFLGLTLFANYIFKFGRQYIFAVHACFFYNCKLAESRSSCDFGLINSSGMFSWEKFKLSLFAVLKNGLEYSDQRQLNLVFDVIRKIDGNVMLQSIDWVLWFLVGFWTFGALHDDVLDSVTNCGCRSSITLLHLFSQLDMGQIHIVSCSFWLFGLLIPILSVTYFLGKALCNDQ